MFTEINCDSVREAIEKDIISAVNSLKSRNVFPKLAVFRVGDDSSQISFENAIIKESEKCGVATQIIKFDANVSHAIFEATLRIVNEDEMVHGIILLRPFPEQIDEEKIRRILIATKDVDAITDNSIADFFVGKEDIFYPCTAGACSEVLKHMNIDLAGKKVTVFGRSQSVGKPISVLMLNDDATVNICHSKTAIEDQIAASQSADIVVLATGQAKSYDSRFFRDGQIILDFGSGTIDGKIHGDLDIEDIEKSEKISDLKYTPVPGGVGQVTTTVLLENLILATNNITK